MIFRASSVARAILGATLTAAAFGSERLGEYVWPTPNGAFIEGRPLAHFLQPTQSGNLRSALWGCVRNGGARFHEGIDLKALRTDRRGEASDAIFAFDAGVVQYVNRDPGKSSYGRYVVIEHEHWMPGMVTLYAHLAEAPAELRPGTMVEKGERIGTMGRSASYAIPKSRAHLHFEIGLWLGPGFQRWYDRQRFDTPNDHGVYNGMNIVGFDVWAMLQSLRDGETTTVMGYVAALPTAVSVDVWDARIPDLLRASPDLMVDASIPANHAGWRIDISASGVPLRFKTLSQRERTTSNWMDIHSVDRRHHGEGHHCASLVKSNAPSPRLAGLLQRLFAD